MCSDAKLFIRCRVRHSNSVFSARRATIVLVAVVDVTSGGAASYEVVTVEPEAID